jgi:hypothetical protein
MANRQTLREAPSESDRRVGTVPFRFRARPLEGGRLCVDHESDGSPAPPRRIPKRGCDVWKRLA